MATRLNGNTISAFTMETHTSSINILNLFATQVTLHGLSTYNLILDLDDEGLYYTKTDDINEIKTYMKKYFKKRYVRTDGVKFDSYFKKTFIKYTKDIVRDHYIIYVNGKNNKGENKIMGMNDYIMEKLWELVERMAIATNNETTLLKIKLYKIVGIIKCKL
jgi:hypothetical protein